MTLIISYPWIAVVVAALFLLLWFRRRTRSAALAGALWLVYAVYEFLIHFRVWCSGECNIRVDLLLLYPVLAGVSILAVWRAARRKSPRAGQ